MGRENIENKEYEKMEKKIKLSLFVVLINSRIKKEGMLLNLFIKNKHQLQVHVNRI